MKLEFTTELLPQAFELMIKGMAGVFIVLFIIYVTSLLLQKMFPENL